MGRSHKRVEVGYATGGLPTPNNAFKGNCAYAEPDEYDANAGGYAETGRIKAAALYALKTAESGRTLSKAITATSASSCSGIDDCGPILEQTSNANRTITPGRECNANESVGFAVSTTTCTAHDHYSSKLTVRYVK